MGPVSIPPNIADEIKDLPMISEVASKLLQLNADEDHSVRDVVRVVETDVYLTSRILRVANSAAFARGKEITSIQRAIMHLGEPLIVSIAIGASTGDLMTKPVVGYEKPEGALWRHCLQEAIAAREVASYAIGDVSREQAYTAGLLLDVGMAVLSNYIEGDVQKLIKQVDERQTADFIEAEQESTGTDHAEVGAHLIEQWGLPRSLSETIRYHHRPGKSSPEVAPLVYTVHVSDIIARMAGFGEGVESLSYTLDEGYRDYVRLDRKKLEELILVVTNEFAKIEEFILSA